MRYGHVTVILLAGYEHAFLSLRLDLLLQIHLPCDSTELVAAAESDWAHLFIRLVEFVIHYWAAALIAGSERLDNLRVLCLEAWIILYADLVRETLIAPILLLYFVLIPVVTT